MDFCQVWSVFRLKVELSADVLVEEFELIVVLLSHRNGLLCCLEWRCSGQEVSVVGQY